MAALAYQTYKEVEAQGSDSSIVVLKPVGLTAGDLMVAQMTMAASNTVTPPSGFTSLGKTTQSSGSGFSEIFYKIADAGDAAASNFTFSYTTATYKRVFLMRFSGAKATDPIGGFVGVASGSGTAVATTTITPESPNTILLFFQCNTGNTISCGSYAIATDNPTWTEVYDMNNNGGGTSMAYSSIRVNTATGAGSATLSGSANNVGQMVALNVEPTSQTISETLTLVETILFTIKSTFSEVITLTETILQKISRLWTKVSKPVTTWTNRNKN